MTTRNCSLSSKSGVHSPSYIPSILIPPPSQTFTINSYHTTVASCQSQVFIPRVVPQAFPLHKLQLFTPVLQHPPHYPLTLITINKAELNPHTNIFTSAQNLLLQKLIRRRTVLEPETRWQKSAVR